MKELRVFDNTKGDIVLLEYSDVFYVRKRYNDTKIERKVEIWQ